MKKKKRCHNIEEFCYGRNDFMILSHKIINTFTVRVMEILPDIIMLGHNYYFHYEEKNPEMSFHHD